MEVSGQLHAPAAFAPWGKSLQHSLERKVGGPQRLSGRGGEGKNKEKRWENLTALEELEKVTTVSLHNSRSSLL